MDCLLLHQRKRIKHFTRNLAAAVCSQICEKWLRRELWVQMNVNCKGLPVFWFSLIYVAIEDRQVWRSSLICPNASTDS
jgi:hypothetical protein